MKAFGFALAITAAMCATAFAQEEDTRFRLQDQNSEKEPDNNTMRELRPKNQSVQSVPSIKSTKAPVIKSTKAPTIKSTKAPTIKSSRRELVSADEEN